MLPTSCMNYVALADTNCIYATRGKSCFKLIKYRTSIRELSIAIRGPKVWDSLPNNIKELSSIRIFKTRLTDFDIHCY